jgi:hypothetical protein
MTGFHYPPATPYAIDHHLAASQAAGSFNALYLAARVRHDLLTFGVAVFFSVSREVFRLVTRIAIVSDGAGLETTLTLPPRLDTTLTLLPGLDTTLTLLPGLDTTLTLLPGLDTTLTLLPGLDTTLTLLPGLDTTLTLC